MIDEIKHQKGIVIGGDAHANTITLEINNGGVVLSAGEFVLVPAAEMASELIKRASLISTLDLSKEHFVAYAASHAEKRGANHDKTIRNLVMVNKIDEALSTYSLETDVLTKIQNALTYHEAECSHAHIDGFIEIGDAGSIGEFGEKQASDIDGFDFEYVSQSCGISGDDYSGHIYYQLTDTTIFSIYFTM